MTSFNWFSEYLSYPGGLSEYIAHFFIQFFIVPFMGAFITAFFLSMIFILSDQLLTGSTEKKNLYIGPISIFLLQLLLSFDAYFFFQGILAYLLCLGCLLIINNQKRAISKFMLAFLLTLILYWIAGPVSILFALCFAILNLREQKIYKLSGFIILIIALAISWLSVRFSLAGNYRISFLPDIYYHPSVKPVNLLYWLWIILPFWLIIYPYLNKIKIYTKSPQKYYLPALQILIVVSILGIYLWKYANLRFYDLKKLDYYARYEQWDNIIDYCKEKTINSYICLCYQNLALAQKGMLTDRLFYFSQHGIEGLEIKQKDIGGSSPLLSDIRFCIGDIASSQRYAFEGNIFTNGGSGRLMKRLVQTNLIYGEYPVAEKYISCLENTIFYRKWAREHRRFLYNDALCLADPLIGAKKKLLPPEGRKVVSNNILVTLGDLHDNDTHNEAAEQYMLAGYLLAKDIRGFKNILSKYRNLKKASELPDAFQQALLVYYENRPDQWKKAGISEINIKLFKQYKMALNNNKNHPQLEKMMMKYFGTTYWFFLHFR